MRRRIANVLAVSSLQKVNVLILGAWGCGVFQNDPKDMAQNFRDQLDKFGGGAFDRIIFAVGREKDKQDIFRQILLERQ